MYCVNGNSSWYINCRPLFGGCPLLGVSIIGGSTVDGDCPKISSVALSTNNPLTRHFLVPYVIRIL